MKLRKTTKKIIAIIIVAVLAAAMCACRPSSRLEKIRYTANADAVDYDQEQIDIEEDGRIEDFLNNVKEQEAMDKLADEMAIGPEDDAGEANDSSQIIYNTAGKDDGANDEPKEKDPNAIYRDWGMEEYKDIGAARASDTDSIKLIADASGIEVELPRNVDRAVAVGLAAQIVEMVAGGGRLAACDEDTKNNEFCKLVMTDLDQVEEWWEGNGSREPISDADFEKLLKDETIDVCFEISGQETFTEEQILIMDQYNISYVALYPVETIEDLETDVRIIGQVMTNGSGGKNDSASRAESYVSWAEQTLEDASDAAKNFSRYTVYLAGWDESVRYRLTLSDNNPFPDTSDIDGTFGLVNGEGTGLAYAYTQSATELFTELAASANVTNTSTISTVRTTGGSNGDFVYVAPVFESYRAGGGQTIDGAFSYYSGNINAGYSPFLYRAIGSTAVIPLGSGDFPAVIATSDEVMEQVAANVFWNYAGYCGPLYTGSYSVYVNPAGTGNWVEGSIESPLEAKWLACRICKQYTEEELLGEIVGFYSRFFFDNAPDQDVEDQLIELVREQLGKYVLMEKNQQ